VSAEEGSDGDGAGRKGAMIVDIAPMVINGARKFSKSRARRGDGRNRRAAW
jgi:hypothetical protein